MLKKNLANKVLILSYFILLVTFFSFGQYYSNKSVEINNLISKDNPLSKYHPDYLLKYKVKNKMDLIRVISFVSFFCFLILGIVCVLIISIKNRDRIAELMNPRKNNLFICIGLFIVIFALPYIKQRNYLGFSGKYYIYTNKIAVFSTALGVFLFIWGILKKIDELKNKK